MPDQSNLGFFFVFVCIFSIHRYEIWDIFFQKVLNVYTPLNNRITRVNKYVHLLKTYKKTIKKLFLTIILRNYGTLKRDLTFS